MAQSRNFAGAVIRKPGAYSRTQVVLAGGFPLAPTGTVALVGESLGGQPGVVQTFTSEDMGSLISLYKAGPIVDAARLLVNPARDNKVPNGASLIKIYKTNSGTQSSLALENAAEDALMTLTSRNFGDDENLISITVEAGSVDAAARIVTIRKGDQVEVLDENPRREMLKVEYTGAELTADLTVTTAALIVAAGADSINIPLAGKSIQDLVDLIDANPNYDASTDIKIPQAVPASTLDPVITELDATSEVTLRAEQQELLDLINSSSLVSASKVAGVEGTLAVLSKTFLTGATRGASSNASFQAGFDALLSERVNTVVPLVSQDASELIPEGETDVASTFTVSSVNLQALTHCITASNTKNRSERNCYVSLKDTFENVRSAAEDLNHERASMLFQDVEVLDSEGNLSVREPWAAAAIVAGIQAGTPVGTPATFKLVNVTGVQHADYNEKTQVDLAIQSGLLPLERRDQGGFRVVVQNSTYTRDQNFVFTRPSVLEAADFVAYNLRQQLEAIYTGEKARTGTAESIKNTVIAIMQTFLDEEIIVGGDNNDQRGWKDLIVKLQGNTALVDITISPVEGVDFILATIRLEQVSQSA